MRNKIPFFAVKSLSVHGDRRIPYMDLAFLRYLSDLRVSLSSHMTQRWSNDPRIENKYRRPLEYQVRMFCCERYAWALNGKCVKRLSQCRLSDILK